MHGSRAVALFLEANRAQVRLVFVLHRIEHAQPPRPEPDTANEGFEIPSGSWHRVTRVMAVAVLVSVAVAVAWQSIRPAITTHLLVFALGALYGASTRRVESRRTTLAPPHEKRIGYLLAKGSKRIRRRRFVELRAPADG